MVKIFIRSEKLLRNHIKFGQILFCCTTGERYDYLDISNVFQIRELCSQNGNYKLSKPIESARKILKDLQKLELRLDTEIKLENMNQNQIDGLLLQASENQDRSAILYILKETRQNCIVSPSRYALEKLLIQYVRDREIIKCCQDSIKDPWIEPFIVANIWYTGDLKVAAQKFRSLYFVSDAKQKKMILFLLREITHETIGFKSEASLVILSSLAEYFVCIFDDYRLLVHIWTAAFKSSWFSDHYLAEELYDKHPELRYRLSRQDFASSMCQSLLSKYDLDGCERLIQLYLKYSHRKASRSKLRRAGVLNRKVTQRLRNIIDTPSSSVVREIFPIINVLGDELEKLHVRTYTNISRQLTRSSFHELPELLLSYSEVAKELFKNEITWGKIISLFAISGGLAVDACKQGNYDHLQPIIEGTAEIIEEELAPWLISNGGWLGLQEYIRPDISEITLLGWLAVSTSILFAFSLIYYFLKFIGMQLYSMWG
uniref:CSON013706 protein n=1 Tax=Culicoides sonorensis TaxID=179676 RepID=A0A336JWG4_CULSO